ncbi:hypothetical protein C9885_29935, partial [Klebsiella pneumoniae]
ARSGRRTWISAPTTLAAACAAPSAIIYRWSATSASRARSGRRTWISAPTTLAAACAAPSAIIYRWSAT